MSEIETKVDELATSTIAPAVETPEDASKKKNKKKEDTSPRSTIDRFFDFIKNNGITLKTDAPVSVFATNAKGWSSMSTFCGLINNRPGVCGDKKWYVGTEEDCLNEYTTLAEAFYDQEVVIGDHVYIGTEAECILADDEDECSGDCEKCTHEEDDEDESFMSISDAEEYIVVGSNSAIPVKNLNENLLEAFELVSAALRMQDDEHEAMRKLAQVTAVISD